MISDFIFKIKRRENKFFIFLYNLGKCLTKLNLPCIRPIHGMLWWERTMRLGLWRWILKVSYYTPLFQSMCFKVGKNLNLVNGLPEINENIKIVIGDNVEIYGVNTSFGGGKIKREPILEIGSNTFIGPAVKIGVCEKISIGNHCLIAARVIMSDNDGHPLGWEKRRQHLAVDEESVKPIIIEDDVWIGEGAFICKGVRIGRGAIVAARSTVTKDVSEFTVVAGNPARVIREIRNK